MTEASCRAAALPWQDGVIIGVVIICAMAVLGLLLRQCMRFLTEVWHDPADRD